MSAPVASLSHSCETTSGLTIEATHRTRASQLFSPLNLTQSYRECACLFLLLRSFLYQHVGLINGRPRQYGRIVPAPIAVAYLCDAYSRSNRLDISSKQSPKRSRHTFVDNVFVHNLAISSRGESVHLYATPVMELTRFTMRAAMLSHSCLARVSL